MKIMSLLEIMESFSAECTECGDESSLNQLELVHEHITEVYDDEEYFVQLRCPNCGSEKFTMHTSLTGKELRIITDKRRKK